MEFTESMDNSFLYDGKLIYYKVPMDKARTYHARRIVERTNRDFYFYNEQGKHLGTYHVYDDFEKLQFITPSLAKEYYFLMISDK